MTPDSHFLRFLEITEISPKGALTNIRVRGALFRLQQILSVMIDKYRDSDMTE